MIASRIFAVLSAILFVLAVAIALDGAVDLRLTEALQFVDIDLPEALQRLLPPWAWQHMAMPVLDRPAWLPPAGLAAVCGGLAVSLRPRRPMPGTKRWWS